TTGTTPATSGSTANGSTITSMSTGADKNTTTPGSSTTPYNSYRYNGMRWDPGSGQYDMGFRNYESGLNAFTSRDMYNGALSDVSLTTDPFTGSLYAFGDGNPISNIEQDGHMPCMADGPCGSLQALERYATAQQNAAEAAKVMQQLSPEISAAGSGPQWELWNAQHTAAVFAAANNIVDQLIGQGYSPAQILHGMRFEQAIPGGSKKGTGFTGRADITFTGKGGTLVGEVKVNTYGRIASDEAQFYAAKLTASGTPASPGFDLVGDELAPAPGGAVRVYSVPGTPNGGGILYERISGPKPRP